MTDSLLYIYICVKHFGMANIKKIGSVNDSFNLWDKKVTFSIVALFVIYDLQIENNHVRL